MDHMGDRTLPDHGVVKAQIRVDLTAVPHHRHIQHHPMLRLKVPLLQPPKLVQLPGLQLRDKAQPTHVDPQNGDFVKGHQLCKM